MPVAMVSGGPNGLQPPSSSSRRIRSMLAVAIWLHMAADLVLPGSALTTAMILASTSLSARTISDFMLMTPERGATIGCTSERLAGASESILDKSDERDAIG